MSSESERIEEVGKYIEATIAEIDDHTENMEKLFKMDRWSKDSSLYEIIINSYERHRNTPVSYTHLTLPTILLV